MIIYIYGKCSTCKNAIRFLEENKIPFKAKEITEHPPSIEELQQMLKYQDGQVKKLFNTSGNLYKEMQLSEKLQNMPLKDALNLLTKHGMLVKRPFLIGKNFGAIGFKEADWLKLMKNKS